MRDQLDAYRPVPIARPAACLLFGLLAGCAGGAAKPAAAPPAAVVTGAATAGTVAAVREVDIGPGAGSRAGVDAVLAALRQPASPATLALQEIVIAQPDGTAVSLGGVYPGFTAGARVTILPGQTTTLAHGD